MPTEMSTDQFRIMCMRMTRLGCINHLHHELEKTESNEAHITILREVIDEKTESLNLEFNEYPQRIRQKPFESIGPLPLHALPGFSRNQ